jgi:hypothetical protein
MALVALSEDIMIYLPSFFATQIFPELMKEFRIPLVTPQNRWVSPEAHSGCPCRKPIRQNGPTDSSAGDSAARLP